MKRLENMKFLDNFFSNFIFLNIFIRCVGGYSLYVILQLLGLFIIARGLGWVFWGLGGGVQVGGGGGGGIFNLKKKFR